MSIQQEIPKTKTIHTVDARQGEELQRDCVCAACYGNVIATHYDAKARTYQVSCSTEDCTCPGFVTRRWYERHKEASLAEALTARIILRQAAPWLNPHHGKSADQLLAELGF